MGKKKKALTVLRFLLSEQTLLARFRKFWAAGLLFSKKVKEFIKIRLTKCIRVLPVSHDVKRNTKCPGKVWISGKYCS